MSPNFSDHFDRRQDLPQSAWGNAACKVSATEGIQKEVGLYFLRVCWEEGSNLMHLHALARKLFRTSKVTCKELKLSCCCLRTNTCFNLEC